MKLDDYSRFEKAVNKVALITVYQKGMEWNEYLDAMFQELAQYPIETIEQALNSHVRHNKFMPTLSDIINAIEGSVDDLAAEAWGLALKAVRRFGHTATIRFPHPAIHYAIDRMGGWIHLCETLTDENEPFRARDFARLFKIGYEHASWNDVVGKCRVPAYFLGFYDARNRAAGYLTRPPEIINAITGVAEAEVERIPERAALGASA